MAAKIILLILAIPALEITLLVSLGKNIGVLNTLAVVFLTGFAGAFAAKLTGMRALAAIREEMNQGRVPGEKMVDAFLIFIAGVLLLTPGLLGDIAGLLLLFPPARYLLRRAAIEKMRRMLPRADSQGEVILIEPPGPGR